VTGQRWRKDLIKPKALRRGDRVMSVTPCWGGPSIFPHVYDAGIAYLEQQFGFQVVEAPHARHPAAWVKDNPKARADDLMMAFQDPSIAGIFVSIGGNDAVRILPYLDLDIIAQNPKVLIGYSDVTTIHFACLKAGISTFYGPSIMSGFAESHRMTFAGKSSFERATLSLKPIGFLPQNTEGWANDWPDWSVPFAQTRKRLPHVDDGLKVLQGSGMHSGRLIGGCAEVLETLKATTWWPDLDYWNDVVLFYETSEEAPSAASTYRWMTNFASQGILGKISGIIFARPGGAETTAEYRQEQKDTLVRVTNEWGLTDLPIIADADIGHTDPIYTLPYGARVRLDCDQAEIEILDSGVIE